MTMFGIRRATHPTQKTNWDSIAITLNHGPFWFYDGRDRLSQRPVASWRAAEQIVSDGFATDDKTEARQRTSEARSLFRIVIADDHEVLRKGLRSALLGAGWQVVGEAANGKETIERVRELKPDLLLLDLSMPVMSGHEAAREILRTMPEVKIVVFTMHESEQVRDALRNIGVHALAVKSAPLSLLLDTIQNLLDGGKKN